MQLPVIVIKFVAKHIRNQFYGLYLARVSQQPLLTEHVNLAQGGRIFITENLTPLNQSIFNAAMNLKREKKLSKVNTSDGLVSIKVNTTDKMTTIKLLRELDLLIARSSTSHPNLPEHTIGPVISQDALFHYQHQQNPTSYQQTSNPMEINNNQ